MQYDDPNHSRRNLVMTSMAFIILNAAGAEPAKDDRVFAPMFLVTLERPWVIILIGTLCLFWFAYRYWEKSPETYDKELSAKLDQYVTTVLRKYNSHFKSETIDFPGHDRDGQTGYVIPNPNRINSLNPFATELQIRRADADVIVAGGNSSKLLKKHIDQLESKYVRPSWWLSAKIAWSIRKYALDKSHSFADWLVPWVLFLIAASLALYNNGSYLYRAIVS